MCVHMYFQVDDICTTTSTSTSILDDVHIATRINNTTNDLQLLII